MPLEYFISLSVREGGERGGRGGLVCVRALNAASLQNSFIHSFIQTSDIDGDDDVLLVVLKTNNDPGANSVDTQTVSQ